MAICGGFTTAADGGVVAGAIGRALHRNWVAGLKLSHGHLILVYWVVCDRLLARMGCESRRVELILVVLAGV